MVQGDVSTIYSMSFIQILGVRNGNSEKYQTSTKLERSCFPGSGNLYTLCALCFSGCLSHVVVWLHTNTLNDPLLSSSGEEGTGKKLSGLVGSARGR